MLGVAQLELSSTLLISVAAAIVGFAAYWSNPRRAVNRAFFGASLHVALWLACLDQAMKGGPNGQFWMRTTSVVGAFIVVSMWLIREAIACESFSVKPRIYKTALWLGASSILAIIPLTDFFVLKTSSLASPGIGWGYFLYMAGVIAMLIFIFRSIRVESLRQYGVKQLELQILLVGGATTVLAVVVLMALRAVFHEPIFVRVQPVIVLLFYTITVFAITTGRVFDARQLFLVGSKNALFFAGVVASSYFLDSLLEGLVPRPLAFLITVAYLLGSASWLRKILNRLFDIYPELELARHALLMTSERERDLDRLKSQFAVILSGWSQCENSIVVSGDDQRLDGCGCRLDGDGTVVRALKTLKWVTPERLERERSESKNGMLWDFLISNNLGVLVYVEGATIRAVVGLGVTLGRRPVTYPQVMQLRELSTFIVSFLERAHFSARVQRNERLATVGLIGASMAHEIRNPLVSIKTFVQLLPHHYADPMFREKFFNLIGDEVMRIDKLTDQLLDLAAPRSYLIQNVDVHEVIQSCAELVAARAKSGAVQLLTSLKANPSKAYTDSSALKQVLLNLYFNAIEVLTSSNSEIRLIEISTRFLGESLEIFVADSGPGISPEMLPRLFQPFQTSKSSGFGLGLAICRDILANLRATISVGTPDQGRGALFIITLPCQQSST